MILVCIQDFGSHKVGDEVEVPDGEDFSPMYFAEKSDDEDDQPAQVALAREEALGEDVGNSSTPVLGPAQDDDLPVSPGAADDAALDESES